MTQRQGVELTIEGRVQGVGFRWSTREKARSLGLAGWVRNEADGSVRLRARGPSEALEDFVRWCEDGPGPARVRRVVRRDLPEDELPAGPEFTIEG